MNSYNLIFHPTNAWTVPSFQLPNVMVAGGNNDMERSASTGDGYGVRCFLI